MKQPVLAIKAMLKRRDNSVSIMRVRLMQNHEAVEKKGGDGREDSNNTSKKNSQQSATSDGGMAVTS